jgi:hypothetical protein
MGNNRVDGEGHLVPWGARGKGIVGALISAVSGEGGRKLMTA